MTIGATIYGTELYEEKDYAMSELKGYLEGLMVQMYGLVLQKRLGDFSRAEREYIVSIGKAAYIRTIERMKGKEDGK